MTTRNAVRWCAASALLATTGIAIAGAGDVAFDGSRATDPYGANLALQASRVIDFTVRGPISAAVDSDQSVPVGGQGVGNFIGGPLNSDPGTVLTGLEGRINLDFLGWDGVEPIRIGGFLAGGNFLSNQVIGGADPTQQILNIGNSFPIDFSDDMTYPGEQFVTVNAIGGAALSNADIDGIADEPGYQQAVSVQTAAGAPGPWAQDNFTEFGDNSDATREGGNGSEINALYAYVSDPDDSLNPATGMGVEVSGDEELNYVVTGNLENNDNRFNLYIDVTAMGQSMGFMSVPGSAIGDYAGIVFESGFTPEWYVRYNRTNFSDGHFAELTAIDASYQQGSFITNRPAPIVLDDADMTSPTEIARFDFDNSNTLGVAGAPQAGSLGGMDEPIENMIDPEDVNNGVEFRLNLSEIGYDPMIGNDGSGGVAVSGFLIRANAVSNQVLGGVPLGTGELGAGSGVNFDTITGNQSVQINTTTTAMIDVDGVRDMTGYPSMPQYVNPGNGTNLTSPNPDAMAGTIGADDDPMGSELNNFSGVLRQEGSDWVLYGFAGGNVGMFDRLYLYFDVQPGGQNTIQADNPNIDDGRSQNYVGLTFESGFEADFLVAYRLGTDMDSMEVTHFADGADIPDMPSTDAAVGGGFGGGPLADGVIDGSVIDRRGFLDNDDATVAAANGSELAALYAYIDNAALGGGSAQRTLNLMFTGNLNTDFNKLSVFIDVDPNFGQNRLIWDGDFATGQNADPEGMSYIGNPDVDFQALQRFGGPFPILDTPDPMDSVPGYTFDDGFTADHFFSVTNGNVSMGVAEIFLNFARLRDFGPDNENGTGDDLPGVGSFIGQTTTPGGVLAGAGTPAFTGALGIDNSNVAGVPASNDGNPGSDSFFSVSPSVVQGVLTGMEVTIPISALQNEDGSAWDPETQNIKVHAIISSGDYGFMSNQVLPPICGPELGDPRSIDFGELDMFDQFAELDYIGVAEGEGRFAVVNSANILTAVDCLPPVGACCMGDMCTIETEKDCVDMGGEWQGADTDCMDNPCVETGACCLSATFCQDGLTQAECDMAMGTFFPNETCAEVTCPSDNVNNCQFDFDNNGQVDGADFGAFGAAFGSMSGDANYNPQADSNMDGVVDGADFGDFGGEFGLTDCCPTGTCP